MAQATYVPDIAHEKAEALAFFNAVLEAIATNNLGATAPTETFPGMWWWDTSTTPPTLRQRNVANSAWVAFAPGLTQAQVEDATSTVFGLVSGELLSQAVAEFAPRETYDFQEFLASGTWTKPADALPDDAVYVQVVGAGGSGARQQPNTSTVRSGGAGGGGIIYKYKMSDLGATEDLIVGAGPAGRSSNGNGSSGGSSAFRASGAEKRLVAQGGQGGRVDDVSGGSVTIRGNGQDIPLGLDTGTSGSNAIRVGVVQGSIFGAGNGGSIRPDTGGANHVSASVYAGRGGPAGAPAADGEFPGGGGGASTTTSGAGADGVVRTWCVRES